MSCVGLQTEYNIYFLDGCRCTCSATDLCIAVQIYTTCTIVANNGSWQLHFTIGHVLVPVCLHTGITCLHAVRSWEWQLCPISHPRSSMGWRSHLIPSPKSPTGSFKKYVLSQCHSIPMWPGNETSFSFLKPASFCFHRSHHTALSSLRRSSQALHWVSCRKCLRETTLPLS